MSKTKSSNELVAKLFETIENKFKDDEQSNEDSESSDSGDSSLSLSLSSEEDSKSKASGKKSKKPKKKKKKKSSKKKKKKKNSSDSSSEDNDKKSKKKKKSKDKVKVKDNKEALHKKLKLVRQRPGLDDGQASKRTSSLEDIATAVSKKAKLDKSKDGVDDAILGAIEKEMTANASQTISEILDDLLGSDRTKLNEKKLLEGSLKSINIKKEKDDSADALKIKKEKVDKIIKKEKSDCDKNSQGNEKLNGKDSKRDKEERKTSSRRRDKSEEKEGRDKSKGIGKSKTDDKEEDDDDDDDVPLPPVADVFVEDLLASKAAQEIAKAKATADKQVKPGKITIGNLKEPTVFKQVEESEKKRRSKYEDGEITPSDNDDEKSSSSKDRKDKKKKKSKKHRNYRTRERSRSRSRDRRSSKSSSSRHHSSRQSSRSRSYRHLSRSPSPRYERERDRRPRRRGRDRDRRHSRSLSLSLSPEGRRRSRSPIDSSNKIDKKKLLEIARKNAATMMADGTLVGKVKKKFDWRMAGKSVEEITEYCKSLSKKGEEGTESSESESDTEEATFHHPFEIKQRPDHIVMNIRNAQARQTRTFQEKTVESSKQLSLQFPVSSGSQHRRTESEWVPVVTTSAPAIMPPPAPVPSVANTVPQAESTTLNFSNVAMPGAPPLSIAPAPLPAPMCIAPPAAPVFFQPDPEVQNMDIGSVVAQRLKAMKRLAENPHDSEAQMHMYHAQKKMQAWAESKQMPGQFTGSTEVRILTPQELAGGSQAWARKEQFETAAPVRGGMGMHLLQKMGWQPGEGLGKNKEGTVEPLAMDIKLDKRGLVAKEEMPQPKKNPFVYRRPGFPGPGGAMGPPMGAPMPVHKPVQMSLDGKHPVSLLHEYCLRRKLGVPHYELASEEGPPHRKMFVFKVIVKGTQYEPATPSPTKKQAKSEAAQAALKIFGLITS